ncbi:deoxyribonuclease II family protein [Capsaspora owczarzaki ATCC 30864]|uniref:deoxyribonuclease II family protein n=1 Tax=Capsaspora owczarzaki (strain ATCC 30864) TaxID=595528 RepID=UPI0001FE3216|nr:deoxyribonuclease II family protein [Capsaspora owczarzaki ATCC 30864]|eukprot:XP_004365434.1 deoxyribonuclease II family protein [Capsaspora owczarzaki ATCC 30864]
MLKLPVNSSSSNTFMKTGNAYAYMDSTISSFKLSSIGLNDNTHGAAALTLQQFYNAGADVSHVFYDDESPDNKTHDSNGHTKGVVGLDDSAGLWMVHSVPRYPPYQASGYSYPDYATTFGQSFFCMSLSLSTLQTVSQQMQLNHPYVFESKLTTATSQKVPALAGIVNGVHVSVSASNITAFQTLGGVPLTAFSKTSTWNQDLYMDLVQPYYKQSMLIETWTNGINPVSLAATNSLDQSHPQPCATHSLTRFVPKPKTQLPSECTPKFPYNSMNVAVVEFAGGYEYTRSRDHSKWAISQNANENVVCIGDINRQASMATRAGGTVCIVNKTIWTAFNSLIVAVDPC